MSVRNAGDTIREVRIRSGLSQEQLSEGICSIISLSRIENNAAGVSPATFQALMERCGYFYELLPTFASRADFDCFYALKKAKAYIESWQFDNANQELSKVKNLQWADNKLHYQEWFLNTYYMNIKSNLSSNQCYFQEVLNTIRISQPNINLTHISHYLSSIELELLIALATEALKDSNQNLCMILCNNIKEYLEKSRLSSYEKYYYEIKLNIVMTQLLLKQDHVNEALKLCDRAFILSQKIHNNNFLYEIVFLTSVCYFKQNRIAESLEKLKAVFYSSYAIGSNFCNYLVSYFEETLQYDLSDSIGKVSLPHKTIHHYNWDTITIPNGSGTYDFFSEGVLYIGTLIKQLRTEKKISATKLCNGLCTNSKLSKIESLTHQPSLELTRALLQRLGVSDNIFVFWGDSQEFITNEMKQKISESHDPAKNQALFQNFYSSLNTKDVFSKQFFLLNNAILEEDYQKRIDMLNQALLLTLPNFDINKILDYRLSYTELSILNNIGRAYSDSNTPFKSLTYLNQVMNYFQHNDYDEFLKSSILSITLVNFARTLCLQDLHSEMISLYVNSVKPFMRYNITILGSFYFFYCQSLSEQKSFEDASFYANFAYHINIFTGRIANGLALKESFETQYGLILDS